MRRKRAFTLVELLVLIAIIAVLVTILVPLKTSGPHHSRKAICATNLKIIGGAFRDYENDIETPDFPRMEINGDVDAALLHGDTLDAATLGTNTMQNVWMLIDEGYLPPEAFRCPLDRDYLPRSAQTRYGWENYNQFSYGMQNPYAKSIDGLKTNLADPTDKDYKANRVFMADMNPGGAVDGSTITHSNHGDGLNYITRVGNVVFHEDRYSSAVYGEEIYDDDGDPGDAWPDSSTDVVITPTEAKVNRATVTRSPKGNGRIALVLGLAVAVAIAVTTAVVVAAKCRKRNSE